MGLRRLHDATTEFGLRPAAVIAAGIVAACAWVGPGVAARHSGPPAAGFRGSYAVAYRVTNTKAVPATNWVFAATAACPAPCAKVSFRPRLVTESSFRPTVLRYTWTGASYVLERRVLRGYGDCRSASGRTTVKGYDVVSTGALRITRAVNSVVTAFSGNGRDSYVPNAAGRKAGCAAGAYTFAIEGKHR